MSMQKIENMLNDIAGVFQRVGTMVRLQETMIERIDKYTDDASANVQKGRKEL
jgi:syntaxin 5